MNNYPNCEKLATPEAETLAEFLEWLDSTRYFLAETYDHTSGRVLDSRRVMYEFLGIDAVELERERQAILREAREVEE